MDCGRFGDHGGGASGAVGEVLLKAGEHGWRQQLSLLELGEAVEEIEREAADIHPVEEPLPLFIREMLEFRAGWRHGVAEG